MSIKLAIVKFFIGFLSAIGGLIFFIGFFNSLKQLDLFLLAIGIFLISITEAAGIYLIKYETSENLVILKQKIWQEIGMSWAFPLLFFILYFINHENFVLAFALASAVFSFFRSASLIIKVYLADRDTW